MEVHVTQEPEGTTPGCNAPPPTAPTASGVPYARVAPAAVFTASTSVTEVTTATVWVHDTAQTIEDWSSDIQEPPLPGR